MVINDGSQTAIQVWQSPRGELGVDRLEGEGVEHLLE